VRGRRDEIILKTGLSKATVANFFQGVRVSRESYNIMLKTAKQMIAENIESMEEIRELKTLLKEVM
jgi:hypothetical protein